jgi:hypothetical protein
MMMVKAQKTCAFVASWWVAKGQRSVAVLAATMQRQASGRLLEEVQMRLQEPHAAAHKINVHDLQYRLDQLGCNPQARRDQPVKQGQKEGLMRICDTSGRLVQPGLQDGPPPAYTHHKCLIDMPNRYSKHVLGSRWPIGAHLTGLKPARCVCLTPADLAGHRPCRSG